MSAKERKAYQKFEADRYIQQMVAENNPLYPTNTSKPSDVLIYIQEWLLTKKKFNIYLSFRIYDRMYQELHGVLPPGR